MKRPVLLGNWKMNGCVQSNEALLDLLIPALAPLREVEFGVFPATLHISQVLARSRHSDLNVGGQHACPQPNGPFTGEVSVNMLAETGCRYVLVGHSERRSLFGQTDSETAVLFAAAQSAGLVPVLCVGESLAERERGNTHDVVIRQLEAVLAGVGIDSFRRAIIAYEPVWAIGTGLSATPGQAQQVHSHIRHWLAGFDSDVAGQMPILYGGSLSPDNAHALFSERDIDGGLVGGASLDAAAFSEIARTLYHVRQAQPAHQSEAATELSGSASSDPKETPHA
jgi:triosephosphate isomerase (TIM)